ncbi:hypothetical protein AVEN_124450-1 [Araneus ventricosus]|uniref:Uncharacterized protein n=1 Tax=Araneus ventricosus TaxID=182803 RepID=A0A4Y2HWJ2_ARAVE|nr:hypothetical protein AVEN_124450-1 [Araneus ventricosus]
MDVIFTVLSPVCWPRWPSVKVSASGPEGSQPISQKIHRVLDPFHAKSYVGGQRSSRSCGAQKPTPNRTKGKLAWCGSLERGFQLR